MRQEGRSVFLLPERGHCDPWCLCAGYIDRGGRLT